MANMATVNSVYQQMVVPAPYHYHQPHSQMVPTIVAHEHVEPKKEPKKRKKIVDKSTSDKRKVKDQSIGPAKFTSNYSSKSSEMPEKIPKKEACPICNKKKCFKHLEAKSKHLISKKTPEDIVIQMKKHMLKLLSQHDCRTFCKIDQKNGQVDIDIAKFHHSYLEEHEPQSAEISSDPSKEYKPKVKKWLYRKIYLDEFKTFEFNTCKGHIQELRRSMDEAIMKKKTKIQKAKPSTPKASQTLIHPQDYSLNNHTISSPVEMSRAPLSQNVVGVHSHNTSIPSGYQPGLMGISVDTPPTPAVSSMAIAGANPTIHNSLAYMTQQVPTNLLFGLGQQQQPPPPPPHPPPTQQQPLNLQTSHQPPMQPGHQPPPTGPPGPPSSHVPHSASAAAPPLPLNLHNPYYVSFGPMLPLHMSAPQHGHQQQFTQNILPPQQQQPAQVQAGFNQHAMYQ